MMPVIVGGIIFWMLSTTLGFTMLLAILTYAVLQTLFGFWTYVPGGDNPGIAMFLFITWGVYYAIAKLFSFVR